MNDTFPIPLKSERSADWLKDFPLAFFSMTMGLASLCLAWEKTSQVMGLQIPVHLLLAELKHPVKLNFLTTVPISLLLLATATLHLQQTLYGWLWAILRSVSESLMAK